MFLFSHRLFIISAASLHCHVGHFQVSQVAFFSADIAGFELDFSRFTFIVTTECESETMHVVCTVLYLYPICSYWHCPRMFRGILPCTWDLLDNLEQSPSVYQQWYTSAM